MTRLQPTEKCFFCGQHFAFGGGRYDGSYVRQLKVTVCRACQSSNWDGLNPRDETKLIEHLKGEGLPPPRRGANGLLRIE
jgi:hypothetical protein